MRIEKIPLARINPAPYNPREDLQPDDPDYIAIKVSIDKFGLVDPLVWNETTGNLVGGHQRYKIIAAGGATEAWCSVVRISEAEERELNFALNRATGRWNIPRLQAVVAELEAKEIDLDHLRPYELLPPPQLGAGPGNGEPGEEADTGVLCQQFLVPPFTVLDARQGYWQERKRAWLALGIKSEVGRGGGLLKLSDAVNRQGGAERKKAAIAFDQEPLNRIARQRVKGTIYESDSGRDASFYGQKQAVEARLGHEISTAEFREQYYENHQEGGGVSETGTSVFDPVLCELVYSWFCPKPGLVLDPFAGGSVRGVVAARLGRHYLGLDLRAEQVEANEAQAKEILSDTVERPEIGESEQDRVVWECGDAIEIGNGAYDVPEVDLIFSCPPYGDLEVYSDNPRDLSAMSAKDFAAAYDHIIQRSVARLRPNRFACFVVGDYRDKEGFYTAFVKRTIAAFEAAGMRLYNEAILVTPLGSVQVRAGKHFRAGRKLEKTHQNVLVFYKGDPKEITKTLGDVHVHAEPRQGPAAPAEAPPEAPAPKEAQEEPKAPQVPVSAPEPPPERDLPDELGGGEHDVPLDGQVWKVSAAWASKIVGCMAELIRAPGGCGAHCCRAPVLWPPSAGRPEKEACYWLGPEGCTMALADKPVTCQLYPLMLNKNGTLVLHNRVPLPSYPCNHGKGGKMVIEVLREYLTVLFGESVYASMLGAVRASQDYAFPVPTPIAAAVRRETKWARANAVPVPRSLFDAGNADALDAMPRDKLEASMACLDGEPSPTKTDEATPKPALANGIQVGEMDDAGNPIPDEEPAPTAPPTPEAAEAMEAIGMEPDAIVKAGFRQMAEKVDEEIMAMGDAPPTLEEVAAKKGIFEALQRSGPPRTAEARDVVLDFETPVEAQPLPRGGVVYVKRDDLFSIAGVRGGKARTCWALATERPVEGLITAGSRMSPQCNIVAHIARRLGVPCRLHIPASKEPLEGELAEAETLGAEIVGHRPGYNTVIVKRARDDAAAHPTWAYIPFGMECEMAVAQTRHQARILERYGRLCERIVVPVGSGMSLAGILWGMRDAGAQAALPILGICVGADPRKRLDEWAPRGWRDAVTLKSAPGKYEAPATRTRLGDLELDPGYEAKCLPYLKPGDLLWVVGIRNCVAGRKPSTDL